MNKLIPNSFDSFFFHKDLINNLKNINTTNLNHLIFYGVPNIGKKTIVRFLLNHIYKTDIFKQKILETHELKIGNNTVNIEYYVSPYHYEFNLYEYGFYDKNVICDFIHKILQYDNINLGYFKIIVLTHFERLTQNAQLCLRLIIEKTSNIGRFICLSSNISCIEASLLSRFTCLRVKHPSTLDIKKYITHHLSNNQITFQEKDIVNLINKYNKNLYKINLTLEYFIYNNSVKKYPVVNEISYLNDLIIYIEKKNIESVYQIRDIAYKLLLVNISSIELISLITKYYFNQKKLSIEQKSKLLKVSSTANCNANLIEYNIIVLEWFVLKLKKILHNNSIN